MTELPSDVTELLIRWSDGDEESAEKLLSAVYDELRQIARKHLRKERLDHTLQPTALVHEAYLRMAEKGASSFKDRTHFFATAARVMRHILVDHARRRSAAKRGGKEPNIQLQSSQIATEAKSAEVVALDDALQDLEKIDGRKARILELRYFGGLTIDETAQVLGLAPPTVVKDARLARAWLFRHMKAGP